MSRRQIFLEGDERGVELIATAAYQAVRMNDPHEPITVYIAHNTAFERLGYRDVVRRVLAPFPYAEVRFANFDPVYTKYLDVFDLHGNKPAWTPTVWAWTCCTELFPEIEGRLIYLDWDMFVCRDLGELFRLPLKEQGCILAAVHEVRRADRPEMAACEWPAAAEYYFNNGVMVIDIDAWRRENAQQELLDWYRRNKWHAQYLEQDAMNGVFGGRMLDLPLKWNYNDAWLQRLKTINPFRTTWRAYRRRDVLEAILDPAIIHFHAYKKPNVWNHRPERRRFHKAARAIGFLQGPLQGETLLRRIEAAFFDLQYFLLRRYARLLLRLTR